MALVRAPFLTWQETWAFFYEPFTHYFIFLKNIQKKSKGTNCLWFIIFRLSMKYAALIHPIITIFFPNNSASVDKDVKDRYSANAMLLFTQTVLLIYYWCLLRLRSNLSYREVMIAFFKTIILNYHSFLTINQSTETMSVKDSWVNLEGK